jgi:hypothetical protein
MVVLVVETVSGRREDLCAASDSIVPAGLLIAHQMRI